MSNPARLPRLLACLGIGLGFALWSIIPGESIAQDSGADSYREPKPEQLPFAAEDITLEETDQKQLLDALVATARNFDLSNRLKAQAIAVALRREAGNK